MASAAFAKIPSQRLVPHATQRVFEQRTEGPWRAPSLRLVSTSSGTLSQNGQLEISSDSISRLITDEYITKTAINRLRDRVIDKINVWFLTPNSMKIFETIVSLTGYAGETVR